MTDEMSDAEKRHDQLTRAPRSDESDAAPRIALSEHDGNVRVDIADSAAVRPGIDPARGVRSTKERGSR